MQGWALRLLFPVRQRFEHFAKIVHQRKALVAPRLFLYGGAFTNFMSGALCLSFFEPQTEPPPMYRSGRLQEEQRLVTKSCPFFWRTIFAKCPNFGGLESSRKSKCPPRKFLRSNNWDLNTWGWSYRKWRQREPYTVCRSGRSGSGRMCRETRATPGEAG